MHYLAAGDLGRPVLLLLHGFPELAFSWRKVMPALAEQGFYVLAPDQRGYGHTTGWQDGYDVSLEPYRMPSLVLDQLAFLTALEITQVAAVIGHDFGSPVAAWSALLRPDVFSRVALLSAPFAGPPSLRSNSKVNLEGALAAVTPPRKHYQWYYSTEPANQDMLAASQGLKTFLAQYYYLKSALWSVNAPHELKGWEALELAKMPGYYIMPQASDMAEVVARDCVGEDLARLDQWLSDLALEVYADEFARTGFQGGLNWYRASTSAAQNQYLKLHSGMKISVPATFIAGDKDWGRFQSPGAQQAMMQRTCTDFRGNHVVADAGHWVQQEQPEAVAALLLDFLNG